MNKRTRVSFQYTLIIALAVLLGGCSQTKNTVMHRGWHNMNARFNGYFYSRENVKESLKKVNKAHKDDFSRVIPLFVYTDNTNAKSYYGDFDKTIKKSSVVIQRHTIMNKRTKKEIPNACRWIDENYMLIGRAHFYKRDLFSALEAFEYVSKIYPNPEAKYSAMLWMVRTQNEIGSYSQSEILIDEIRTAEDFPKERAYEKEFALVQADYHIKRGDYTPAIKHLSKGIALTKNKKERARYLYVLAQLYEKQGDNKKASQYYGMVPRLHPYYDMEFNAQINRARLYDVASSGSKTIKKQLQKMLRDDKNVEFQDQIYYALAEIASREGDTPQAIAYLDKSIKASVSNNTQKALSYLKRADIYFERTDYKEAQANYDSTMTFLPKDYVDYKIVEQKKKSLTGLVTNLNVITLEDSLQRLARMSEKERNSFIDKLIAQIEEEERRQEEERLQAQENQQFLNTNTTNTAANQTGSGTSWYFYNQATISFGIGEFTKKWGSRKLEDNWRRSEKDQVLANNLVDENGEPLDSLAADSVAIAAVKASKNKKDRGYYLKNIPLTPDALAKSHTRIVEAYYNVGSIYKEELLNNKKSVEAFEELLSRYPENKYKLSSLYQLYRTYLLMNNQSKSDYYKNIILNDHPKSEYAQLIRNPNYASDIAASKSEVERFYSETYQHYSEGNYRQALANALRADSLYSKSYLMPQFAFVKALAIGRTQDINAFEAALTQVVIKYPKEPVKARAQEMLDMIKLQKNPQAAAPGDTAVAPKSKFVFNEDGDYFWVAIVDNGKGDINKFKTAVSNLNATSFSTKTLEITSVFLDISHQLVSVKTFAGKDEAMNYYQFMKASQETFKDLEPGSYQSFVISAQNYTIFYKEKNIEEYKTFFTQNFRTN